jgi:hypothetical protein
MTKPRVITDKDIQTARDMVERARQQLSPEDHAGLAEAVEIVAEVRALLTSGEYDDEDEDDPRVGEQLLARAIEQARTRVRMTST